MAAPRPRTDDALGARSASPYRIMVVDDSAVIRGLLVRSLESDPDLAVVVSVANGQMALSALQRHDIEIIILDIEMPVMDGLTALPKLIAAKPSVQVIMASTMTRRGADISLAALAAGAADYVTKPGQSALTTADMFKNELLAKVKALAHARRHAWGKPQPSRPVESTGTAQVAAASPSKLIEIKLRPVATEKPDAIAIGSSTGGPQALFQVLGALKGLAQPIFITQHMPPTFTTILGEHITRLTGLRAAEAIDGELVEAGRVYIAPGDFHMVVEASGARRRLRLNQAAPENFCRPSVDPMLRSLAQIYGRRLLCAILTGMGRDGRDGSEALAAAGGTLIAQDEKTSVVWGMPGAVAAAGLCSAVLPLEELGRFIANLANRSES